MATDSDIDVKIPNDQRPTTNDQRPARPMWTTWTTCGTTKATWGWWCSRGIGHDGPCALRRLQTPWGLAWEWVARRLTDRKRLVGAVTQLQAAQQRRAEDLTEIRRLRAVQYQAGETIGRLKADLEVERATIARQTQHLEANAATIRQLQAQIELAKTWVGVDGPTGN